MADYLKTEALKDIADAFEATTKVLVNHTKRLDVLERNLDDLFDITSRTVNVVAKPVKKANNKRMLLVAVGIGVYVGYKLAEKDLNERKKDWQETLKSKQPANATPKAENGTDEPQS